MTQEEKECLNTCVTIKETKSVIKKLHTKKIPVPNGFTDEFYKMSQELTPILQKLFQKIGKEETHPNPLCEDIITLIPKPDKEITESYKIISLMDTGTNK